MTTKTSSKKSGSKKRATKATSTKKTATKRAGAKKAATKTARKATGATVRKQSVKVEEERARYLAKIKANEARLGAGEAANGKPLTPEQAKTTQDILARQRELLAELDEVRGA